jgi:hypothetical protein
MILLPMRSTFSLIASCSKRICSKAACISVRNLDKKKEEVLEIEVKAKKKKIKCLVFFVKYAKCLLLSDFSNISSESFDRVF